MTTQKLSVAAVSLAAALLLTGCGDPTEDLLDYLTVHEYEGGYSDLTGGEFTVTDSGVTVEVPNGNETAAMDHCEWISEWLYDDQGEEEDYVKIINEDNRVLSRRRAVNDVCSFGSQ